MKMSIMFYVTFFVFHFSCINAQDTINVPEDYQTIQQGIDAAADDDLVLVDTGTYLENINFNGKAILLASHFILNADTNHINNTIIDGNLNGPTITLNNDEDTTSVICGFTITGGTGLYVAEYDMVVGGGIAANSAGVKVLNSKVIDNEINHSGYAMGGGIGCLSEDEINWLVARDNLISGNHCYSDGIEALGAGVYTGTKLVFENNEVSYNTCTGINNAESNAAGIVNGSNTHNVVFDITDNYIHHNHCEGEYVVTGAGVFLWFGEGDVTGNQIWYNSGTTGNVAAGGGIRIHAPTGIIKIKNNEFLANSLEGNAAQGGGMQIDQASEKIYIENNLFEQNTLEGYTVAGGGGLLIMDCNEVLVNKNTFQGNVLNGGSLGGAGGGIDVINPQAKTEIRNNHFVANEGEGKGFGGGASVFDGYDVPVEIDANIFEGNSIRQGGGLFSYNCYNTTVSNNLFSGNNTSEMGGGYKMRHDEGESIEKVLPVDLLNQSINEPLPCSARSSDHPLLVNNTFVGNTSGQGGAIYCDHEAEYPIIINSIFWENEGNEGSDIYYTGTENMLISYSDINTDSIYGFWEGEGNIHEDPLFEGSDTAYYQLTEGSPCIDAGILDTSGLNLPPWDIMGNYRVWDGNGDMDTVIDMGAYEYGSTPVMPGIDQLKIQNSMLKIEAYPNPTQGIIDLKFTIYKLQTVSLKIFDLQGREMVRGLHNKLPNGKHVIRYDASCLPDGIYIVRLKVGERVATTKLIKIN